MFTVLVNNPGFPPGQLPRARPDNIVITSRRICRLGFPDARGFGGHARKENPMSVGRLVSTIGFCLVFSLALLPGGGRAADDDARERAVLRDFNAAAALQNAGLYDRAGEKWTAFISQNPGDTRLDRAYYYLGISQLHSKKYAAAIDTFQTLPSKYPAFPNVEGVQYSLGMARYQAALESKKREDFKSAAETLAAAAAKYPQGKHTAAALYYQGESLLAAGDPKAAMEAYRSSSPALRPARLWPMPTTPWEQRSKRRAAIPRRSPPSKSSSARRR